MSRILQHFITIPVEQVTVKQFILSLAAAVLLCVSPRERPSLQLQPVDMLCPPHWHQSHADTLRSCPRSSPRTGRLGCGAPAVSLWQQIHCQGAACFMAPTLFSSPHHLVLLLPRLSVTLAYLPGAKNCRVPICRAHQIKRRGGRL